MTDPATHALNYPYLARGVRLHWSDVRNQHWLLFPEGALALNDTAAAILAYCDGHHALDDMVTALQPQFPGIHPKDIQPLLLRLIDRGLLVNPISP